MNREKRKSTSILSYWTVRYVVILCAGLLLVALVSVLWVRQTAMTNGLQMMGLLAQEIAERVSSDGPAPRVPEMLDELIENRKTFFKLNDELCVTVTGADGRMLYNDRVLPPQELRKRLNDDFSASVDPNIVTVTSPVVNRSGEEIGHVTLLQTKKALTYIPRENGLLAALFVGLAAFGWLTVYLLSRKLSRPIRQVAAAARQVSEGSYDIRLEGNWREREIGELVGAFKEMTARLKQLEEWRALMLAGVTHELKTPVTSVKGLVHAVREGVVKEEEAEEFLDIALKETERLQTMIGDLLDYDALAAGGIAVRRDKLPAEALIGEILHQWNMLHGEEGTVFWNGCAAGLTVIGDALRIQQMMTNLLNNALQARSPDRPLRIEVSLSEQDGNAVIAVADNGYGIAEAEQPFVFERFFRGERKRQRVRGLGLGLPFSRMLAQAQGGELNLAGSSPEGTVFVLRLPLGPGGG